MKMLRDLLMVQAMEIVRMACKAQVNITNLKKLYNSKCKYGVERHQILKTNFVYFILSSTNGKHKFVF